jgi:hypothetical protein
MAQVYKLAINQNTAGLAGCLAANVLNHYTPNKYNQVTRYPESGANARKSGNNKTRPKRILKKYEQDNALIAETGVFKLYPSPADGELFIELDLLINPKLVTISNLLGEIVLTSNVNNQPLLKVNTTNLTNGTYTLKIIDNSGKQIQSKKLVVLHKN